MKPLLCAFALLILPVGGSTILHPNDADGVTAADYAALAAGYDNVGRVTGSGLSGSGVWIGGNWVLTAGHVGFGKSGGTFRLGSTSYSIAASIVHPGYISSPLTNDLALLRLADPVTGATPARMGLFTDTFSPLALEATWVGHGFGGNGVTGAISGGSPIYSAFTNVIDAFGPDWEGLPANTILADFDKPDGSTNAPGSSPTATRLEGQLAPGDSGGAVFVEVDGQTYLIGINSFRSTLDSFPAGSNSRYGAASGASYLPAFYGWIEENSGIRPVPEPATGFLALLAAATLLHRRRAPQFPLGTRTGAP